MPKRSGFIGAFEKNAREHVRAEFKMIRGELFIDLRVFVTGSSLSKPTPTQKGLCVSASLAPKLRELLDQAIKLSPADD